MKENEEDSLDRAIRNLEVHVIKKIIVDLFVNEDDRMYAISNAIFERKNLEIEIWFVKYCELFGNGSSFFGISLYKLREFLFFLEK